MEISKQINRFLISGKQKDALDLLLEIAEQNDQVIYNTIIHLKGRFADNERDNIKGIISRDEYLRNKAQITYGIQEVLKDFSINEAEMVRRNSMDVRGNDNVIIQDSNHLNVNIGNYREGKLKDKILFVTSNPSDTTRLRIDKEAREIEEGLKRSNKRDSFDFIIRLAARTRDLSRAILEENPQFLHFSGHGELEGIVLEDESGNAKIASTEAISGLFGLFSDTIKCVFLNSCYSEDQAREISKSIPYVVGMSDTVPDTTAITFATSFYDAIGAGRGIEFAFKFGKSNISLEGLTGDEIPVLLKKKVETTSGS